MVNFLLIMILTIGTFAGCAKLEHIDQLLTLKAVSDEQAVMDKEVDAQDKKFELLVSLVKSGDIHVYNQRSIVRKFGQPVVEEHTAIDGQNLTLWTYRYSVKFFSSPKVYLTFDESGKLTEWKFEDAPAKEVSPTSS